MRRNHYQPVSPMSPMSGSPLASVAIAEECIKIRCKSGENLDRTSLRKQLKLSTALPFDRVFVHKEDVPLCQNLVSKYVPEENLVSLEEDLAEIIDEQSEAPECLSPSEAKALEAAAQQQELADAARPAEFLVCGEVNSRITCASIDAKRMLIFFYSEEGNAPVNESEDPTITILEKKFDGQLGRRDTMYDSDNRPVRDNLKTRPLSKLQREYHGEIRNVIGKC